MKRLLTICTAVPSVMLAAAATAQAEPAILYIPTEAVTLHPTNVAPCTSQINAGGGCYPVEEETSVAPFGGDLDALVTGLQTALEPYDVTVISGGADARPPAWVPYTMLLPDNMPSEMGTNFACVSAGIACGARKRNSIILTNGGTANCTDPDQLHAALYAFGRVSGLEGTDGTGAMTPGVMNYPPDYANPATTYADACLPIVPQQVVNDEGEVMQSDDPCVWSQDHVGCEQADTQNSHADLLEFYGPRPEMLDTDAPTVAIVSPEDGATFQAGEQIMLDFSAEDASDIVAAEMVLESPALEGELEGGVLRHCTNSQGVCFSNWSDASFWKATDSDWTFGAQLPPGTYTATFQAADPSVNVSEPVSIMFTVEGSDGGTGGDGTGGDGEGGDGGTGGDGVDAGGTTGGGATGGGGGEEPGADSDDSGCGCSTRSNPRGGAFALLGLIGLGLLRRRRN